MSPSDGDVKRRILAAARMLFAKHGFEGTTIRQIGQEANANIALVSYYFGGKEGLFAAMLDHFVPIGVRNLNPSLHPVAGLKHIIREICLLRREQPELVTIIQQEIMLDTKRIDSIRSYLVPMWMQLREWLKAGKEQGVFRYESLDTTFSFIVGSLLFVQDNAYWGAMREQERPSTEKIVEDATAFLMNALCVGASSDIETDRSGMV